MSEDHYNYADHQGEKWEKYAAEYRAFLASLTPEEREKFARAGLDQPENDRIRITQREETDCDSFSTEDIERGTPDASRPGAQFDGLCGIMVACLSNSNPLLYMACICNIIGLRPFGAMSLEELGAWAGNHSSARKPISKQRANALRDQIRETYPALRQVGGAE